MKRHIKKFETTSIGKKSGQNNDGIYVGENFVAVIDGVSNKSAINKNGTKVEIADIITEAIKKIDRPYAPDYAKKLTFEEFVTFINMYIKKYCENIRYPVQEKPLEATGAIYSKYYNQIWLVGDCRAIYDGNIIQNELKIDEVFTKIRIKLTNALLEAGYTGAELLNGSSIEREIMENPEMISKHLKDEKKSRELINFIKDTMYETLIDCGFTEDEIESQNLLTKYYTPKELQKYFKNNSNVGSYGYSVFNGIETEIKNCIVKNLPENVKTIKLSSDGIPIEVLNKCKDTGTAIRTIRKRAKMDPLSIESNRTLKSAYKQSNRNEYLAVDDATAVIFEIEYENERNEER